MKSVSHTLNYVNWLVNVVAVTMCDVRRELHILTRSVAWLGVAGGLLAVAQLDTLTIQNIQGMMQRSSALI